MNRSSKKMPDVCRGCKHIDQDRKDEYSPIYYYCEKGVFLPVKSNSCKRREPSKKANL